MYTNGVSSVGSAYTTATYQADSTQNASSANNTAAEKTGNQTTQEKAAVYEPKTESKSTSANGRTKAQNEAIVRQLKADMEQRKKQLQDTVFRMMNKQSASWQISQSQIGSSIYDVLRSGNFTADADTIAQAKADVAEDGYWGVEQTSDRILSFAKALAGDDVSKADQMMEAFKKGYQQATGAWGDKLPDISQKTYDAVVKKFDEWKNADTTATTMETDV